MNILRPTLKDSLVPVLAMDRQTRDKFLKKKERLLRTVMTLAYTEHHLPLGERCRGSTSMCFTVGE